GPSVNLTVTFAELEFVLLFLQETIPKDKIVTAIRINFFIIGFS
ncbi:MAG: hypothetical protein JWR67_3951, partial [Mucilaginibacter sp.]|nr:hypothetical protein [Mucilaginibacter sp.]